MAGSALVLMGLLLAAAFLSTGWWIPTSPSGVVGSKKFLEKKIAELEDVRRRYVKV